MTSTQAPSSATSQPRRTRPTPQVILGRAGRKAVVAPSFGPVLVLGPQRSRKTTGIVVPALVEWPGPALVVSPGPEVVDQVWPARNDGYTMILDPLEMSDMPDSRMGWNPLDHARNWEDAQAMARIVVAPGRRDNHENEMWHACAIQLLAPHIFAAAANGYTMSDVVRWIDTEEEFEVRSLLQATGVEEALTAAESAWQREGAVKSAIYATAKIDMEVWWLKEVRDLTAEQPRFTPARLLDGGRHTHYVCTPPDVRNAYRALTTAVAWDTIRQAYTNNRGFASSILGLRGSAAALDASRGAVTPLLVVLDDAGAVAAIPDLDGLVSTAAKVAVQLVTVFGDLSEIQALYGVATARSIVNHHSAVMIMPGSHDPATAALVGDLLHGSPVEGIEGPVTGETIRRLPWGKALCIIENRLPAIVDLRSSVMDRDLLESRGVESGGRWRGLRRAMEAIRS